MSERTGNWRRERLLRSRLYVVTGGREGEGDLSEFLEAILEAGVDIVQLRDKSAEAGDVLRRAELFRDGADRHGALFVLNDRPDVALAAGADGVHLGQNDLPVGWTRTFVGEELLIGLSTHDEEQLHGAPAAADYVCVGPVHETPTKPGRPATGLRLVRAAAGQEQRPWFAIGGISSGTVDQVVAAGARRIVVVRAVTEAPDAAAAVRSLARALPEIDWTLVEPPGGRTRTRW